MRTKFLIHTAILFLAKGFAQDPQFVNPQQSLLYVNPSFAGSNGLLRTQSLYRAPNNNQLFSSATLYNSVDVYVKPMKGAFAFTHVLDNYGEGLLKTSSFALTYAQHFSFFENKLKIIPSLQVAYLQKDLDKSKISFGNMNVPGFINQWCGVTEEETPTAKKRNADFSSGLLVNYKNFYFGTSVFHMSQPNDGLFGDSRLPARLVVHSSYSHQLNMWTSANYFVQYQRQDKNNFAQLKINFLIINHLIFGMSYFSNNAASINIGYKNKYFTLGVGYDQRLKNIQQQLNSALEIQFSLNIGNKEHRKSGVSPERW